MYSGKSFAETYGKNTKVTKSYTVQSKLQGVWQLHLKEIELENFKSFGRRVSIPFLKGFTAITGPNGSGKSNISDAILFVLGPRSSKAIRAKNLSDLIFNGGKSKSPSKFCKVSLIFYNDDRTIPIDEGEVKLTRLIRISKTDKGKYNSYFYVNGKPSSQTEFENLLAHARISADGYNMVRQGDINNLTQLSPVDRRKMLDDVAGISRFDKDIQRAEEKRKQVEADLEKIGILTDEIKRQLKELDRDRSDALKYKDIKEKLYKYKILHALKKKESYELQIKTFNGQIEKFEKEKVETEGRKDEIRQNLRDTRIRLEEIEKELADLSGGEASKLKEKIDEIKLNQMRSKDLGQTAKEDIDDYKRGNSKISADLKTATKQLKVYEKNLIDVEEELNKHKTRKSELSKELKELEELAAKSDTDLMNMQREITKLGHDLDTKRELIHKQNLEKELFEDRLKRLESDIQEADEQIKKYEFELQENDWHLKELEKPKDKSESAETVGHRLNKAREKEKKLFQEAKEMEGVITNLTREKNNAKMQAKSAELISQGYNRAVQTILDARDTGKLKGIHGTIAELGNVNEKYNDALIVAAGGRMQSIVVDSDENAAQAISYLKKNNIGRATFLPLNKMVTGKPNAKSLMAVQDEKTIGFAIDLVEFDKKYKPAFWYVFGDTVVVKDLTCARKLMGGVRLVTLDGDLIEPYGAMVGGTIPQRNLKFGIPTENEINKITNKLQKAIEHSEKITADLQDVREEILELENRLRQTSIIEETQTLKKKDLESSKKASEEKLKLLKDEYKEKYGDFEKQQKDLEKLIQNITKISEEFSRLESDRDSRQELMLKATSREIADKINTNRDEITILNESIHDLTLQQETLRTHIKMYNDKSEEYRLTISETEEKIKECELKISDSKKAYSDRTNELNKLLKVEQTMSKDQEKLSNERDKLMTREVKLENEIEKLSNSAETTNDLIVKTNIQIQETNSQIADVINELQTYDYKAEEFVSETKSLDELKKLIPEYERKLVNLEPNLNLRAIDEYEKQSQRNSELNEKVSQLEVQMENLNNLVDELMTKKKEGLMKVFNAVNENFKEIFHQISIGGTAELLLENPKTPFEGGLMIKARPRNKKALRLEALSGGEKSLTALALIFAIQRYQPSPFYVLDEVDMFLDAINAENVGKMVTKNAEFAQFILISLRKVTFKDADHVYGVTMQGTGISYLIGKVNLTEVGDDGEIMKDLEDLGDSQPEDMPEVTGG